MNTPNPLISVVLPLRDRAPHADEAVQSVFDQTYRPIELLLVDSTAGGLAELESVIAKAPQGILIRTISKQDCSAAQSINAGMHAARGEYIALLSADDAYAPSRLERCAAAALSAGVVVTYLVPYDDSGRPLPIGHRWRANYDRILLSQIGQFPSLSCLSAFMDIVATPGNLFIRRDVLGKAGEFADFPQFHYLDFFLRAALLAEPFVIREKLLIHRVRSASTGDAACVEEHAAVIRKHLVSLMTGARPANPLADVFEAHPCVFAQTGWTEALNKAFDGLIEYCDPAPGDAPVDDVILDQTPPGHSARRVTLVTHELSLTGAPVIVLELASLLRERGCAVTVLSLYDGPLRPEFGRRGINVKVPPLLLDRMARLQGVLARLASVKQKLPERIVHRLARHLREFTEWVWQVRLRSHVKGTLVLNSICSWPLALRLASAWKGPAFWYIHETMDAQWLVPGARINSKLQQFVADGRLKMLYGSDATRQHWAGNGYEGQVRYWSGISKTADLHLASSQRALRQKRGRRMILNAGMVGGRKGTRSLVEAFALGRAEGLIPGDVELCVVGCERPSISPDARDIIRRVLKPDLLGHVRLVHTVLPGALRAFYDAADIYAHASLFDCMPLALLTAMAHGLPIVATDADGCKEAILHETCGLLVQPSRPRQMAEALGSLLAQPGKARAFGEAARERFVDRFSVEATFGSLYDALVEHESRA